MESVCPLQYFLTNGRSLVQTFLSTNKNEEESVNGWLSVARWVNSILLNKEIIFFQEENNLQLAKEINV